MTLREQVLTVVRGGKVDRVPFTCYKGLLPAGEILVENLALVSSAPAFQAHTPDVSVTSRELSLGVRETTMETPWGTLTQAAHTETGYGSAWTKEHWIKRPEDYEVVEQVIRHTQVTPDPEPYRRVREDLGDRGVVLAWLNRTPFQRLWIEYAGMERLALDLMDCPDAVEGVLDAMLDMAKATLDIVAESEAELIWVPDNITGEMTGPAMFDKYLIPYYDLVCDVLLPAGKTPCCHMDGMLRQVAHKVAETRLPVIEAFTPPPDGNFSVAEARDRWPEKTLWLNYPSSVHLSSPEEITRVTEDIVAQAGRTEGFLVGVTENIPADVGWQSLEAIGKALA